MFATVKSIESMGVSLAESFRMNHEIKKLKADVTKKVNKGKELLEID